MKKTFLILALLLTFLVNIYSENPYKQFGSEGVELLTEQERSGEYIFEIKSTPSDSTSNFLYFNVKEGTATVLSINNDTIKIVKIDPTIVKTWLSIDPLAQKYPSVSPYVGMGNNPVIFVDARGDSINLGNLTDVDKNGNLKNRALVQSFEAFASSKDGRKWILDRAHKGFSYQGLIYKDLNINATTEGNLSSLGIDYIFEYDNPDRLDETRAGVEFDRVKISINLNSFSANPDYSLRILEKTNTLIHEAWYHGYHFEKQFLSGKFQIKDRSNFIVPTNHQHYGLDLLKPVDKLWYRVLQNSLETSLFGKNGFKLLNNINMQYNVNQTVENILEIMRHGFHEYNREGGYETFKKNISR